MAATSQFSVTNVARAAVTAKSYCNSVTITENRGIAGWPTADFLISKPLSTSTQVRVQAGARYTFPAGNEFFVPGNIVGYVEMVTGSTTFDQDEDNISF